MFFLKRIKTFINLYIRSDVGKKQDAAWQILLPGIKKDKKLVVFLVPAKNVIAGGILSIFSLAKTSRLFKDVHGATVIVATFPSAKSYFYNRWFRNNEPVFRFSQVCSVAPCLDKLIVHIPEYLVPKFGKSLSRSDRKKLKNIPSLHLNILNQNGDLMPPPETVHALRQLNCYLTQTIAHYKNATPELIALYDLPAHLIPALIDLSEYAACDYEAKDNMIAYSNDAHPEKQHVLSALQAALPEYRFIEIRDMAFEKYMETIAKAKYTISFGEGFDAYLMQPLQVGSLGIAVYNDRFFPDIKLLQSDNVFSSYNELIDKLPGLVEKHAGDPDIYRESVKRCAEYVRVLYDLDDYQARIKNFYLMGL